MSPAGFGIRRPMRVGMELGALRTPAPRLESGVYSYLPKQTSQQLVAVVAGAVSYATGYLHSLYTAAEHSIMAFFGVLPSVDRGTKTALSVAC